MDQNLMNINTVPEYIQFVNEVQEATFNGSFAQNGVEKAYRRDFEMRGATYRIYAKPFRPEDDETTDFANRKPKN